MGAPTRLPNGVSTAVVNSNLGMFPLPDPTEVALSFYDFNQYVAADWTVTNTSAHDTIGLVAASATVPAGGVISIAGGASTVSTDVGAIQATPLNFYLASTNQVWFYAHLQVDVALNNLVVLGIADSMATAAPAYGMYFQKAAAAATVDFVINKNGTKTTLSSVATMTNAGNIELGFYYNGKDQVDVFVNEVKVASTTTTTNLPLATAMGAGLAMKAAATAPTTAYAYSDFILAAQSRAY